MRYRVIGLVLGALTCDGRTGSKVDRPARAAPPPPTVVLSDRDLDAYVAGTRMEIRTLNGALQMKRGLSAATLDSVGARAAGVALDQYRALTRAVAAALKSHIEVVRKHELDSLRIELLVLRVRAEGMP